MIDITINRPAVNIEALDEQLRAALGAVTSGLSAGQGQVIVHLSDTASPAQIAQANLIVTAHDATALSPTQQAALMRLQQLTQARQAFGAAEIDLTPYTGAGVDPLVLALAQKILWLEREIVSLHQVQPESTSPIPSLPGTQITP